MGLIYNATTGKVEYLIDLEGGSGGGSVKQSTLLSITTAPSGTFEKGSQYYNSNTKLIYTAIDDNTWTGAKTSDPEFGTIYIYDNQGITEYYQWDGDNLVGTDLEKYQLIANKSDDYTESSKNKYPSSYALAKGLSTARPSKVTNSGTSLPATTGYQLGDTFLNTTDKKIYGLKSDSYELNTNTNNSTSAHGSSLTINYETGVISNFKVGIISGPGYGYYNSISRGNIDYRWVGVKQYRIHFKLNSQGNTNSKYQLFNVSNQVNSANYGYNNDVIVFGIKNRQLYIQSYHIYSYMGSGSYSNITEPQFVSDIELEINKEYFLTINKDYGGIIEITISKNNYTDNIIETKTTDTGLLDVNNYNNYATIYYGAQPPYSTDYSIISNYLNNFGDSFSIGEIHAIDSSGVFFKASGSLVWNSGESLIDLSQYADITNGIMYFYCENQLFSNLPKNLSFTNVSASNWVADNTYADYEYKCDLSCSGVKANMFAQVIFNPTEADSGNYATVAQTGNNIITIYSKVNDTITIPNIVVMGV